MGEQQTAQVVQQLYAAFGRGDLPTILDLLAPHVEWWYHGPSEIPFAGQRRGREQVAQFFQTIVGMVDVEQFGTLGDFIVQGDKVAVHGHERVRVKANGRTWETQWVTLWTIRNGQVTSLDEFSDTAAVAAALRGG